MKHVVLWLENFKPVYSPCFENLLYFFRVWNYYWFFFTQAGLELFIFHWGNISILFTRFHGSQFLLASPHKCHIWSFFLIHSHDYRGISHMIWCFASGGVATWNTPFRLISPILLLPAGCQVDTPSSPPTILCSVFCIRGETWNSVAETWSASQWERSTSGRIRLQAQLAVLWETAEEKFDHLNWMKAFEVFTSKHECALSGFLSVKNTFLV